ncbi:hypothetical protein GJ700_32530 [Duganella sp. FT92W]|uniref:Uncharacterized protein n=1 Tax=Pseudoduganella rivuli TaxID=2666085 RepID=A0A7X2IVV4_9BURK|nr:hypothetical protein [Pseudoduganella rivuli]MRV76448.1 hypothetical protein [Pseudoduganella rivuli]
MVNQEHPEGDKNAPQAPVATPVFTGAARRRFTKAGALAAGAVLTLKSQPGMAANSSGCVFATPSAAGSFAINRSHGPKVGYCNAVSPGYWKEHPTEWPKQPWATTKSMTECYFQKIFPVGRTSQFYNQKLITVIGWGGGDIQDVARHLIAAYLNAMKGYTSPYLTTAKVQEIWTGYNSAGGYKPAGKVWSSSDVSNYIKGTWGEGTMWT